MDVVVYVSVGVRVGEEDKKEERLLVERSGGVVDVGRGDGGV